MPNNIPNSKNNALRNNINGIKIHLEQIFSLNNLEKGIEKNKKNTHIKNDSNK